MRRIPGREGEAPAEPRTPRRLGRSLDLPRRPNAQLDPDPSFGQPPGAQGSRYSAIAAARASAWV